MRTVLIAAIYISAFMLVAACSPESASIQAQRLLPDQRAEIPVFDDIQAPTESWVLEDGGQGQLDFNPQVDILFVTDDSDSMRSAQQNLFDNMEKFTRGITKNKMIDFHIGVISVWDSSEPYIKANAGKYGIGELRHIKDSKGQRYNRRYAIKTDSRDIIASTLKIGAVPLKDGGPEWEEMFSPLAAALEKSGRGAVNEGFFRQDAHLVVIFLTDAEDSSKNITPEQMAQTLLEFKGNRPEKLSVYGALVRASDPDSIKDWSMRVHPKYHPECFDMTAKTPKNNGLCKGFGPELIERMILKANENSGTPQEIREKYIIAIASKQFGTDLAKIGDSITAKTLEKEILLSQRPRLDEKGLPMVRVSYGAQVIPLSDKGGWLYNPVNNSVVLPGNINYNYVEGARFTIELVPLNLVP